MENKQQKQWLCGCGFSNTEDKCKQCGEPKGERKEFFICETCKNVSFSGTHNCSK